MKFTMTWTDDGVRKINETYNLKATSLKKAREKFEDMIKEFNWTEQSRYGKNARLREILAVVKSEE